MDITKHVECFNRIAKRLVVDLAARYSSDAQICRIKDRIILMIDFQPIHVVESVGSKLYSYSEQILADNEDFFIKSDFENHLHGKHSEMISYIINKLKLTARNLNDFERAEYRQTIKDLLGEYIDYLICKKRQT